MMLQQTQVDRVIPYYRAFLKRFPTVRSLAMAPLGDVLRLWQGLGYNRRAKMLHEAAKVIVVRGGRFPQTHEGLVALPGVGPYTAAAVRAFAFNEFDACIETNIRAALIHHFFPRSRSVPDTKLLALLARMRPRDARTWYWALMDYGAHLKKTIPNPSRRSRHHIRQSAFEGSVRQLRGTILRSLLRGEPLPRDARRAAILAALAREGLVVRAGRAWRLPT